MYLSLSLILLLCSLCFICVAPTFSAFLSRALMPSGGVTRQGVVISDFQSLVIGGRERERSLTDLHSLLIVKLLSLSFSLSPPKQL